MRLMADERIYRHDNVSIGTLATKTFHPRIPAAAADQPTARLPQFQCLPSTSTGSPKAKAALADPSQAEVPVITIAMDAGFHVARAASTAAFKATTGVTPT